MISSEVMHVRRLRIKHKLSFSERLQNEASRLRMIADALPPGLEQERLVAKASQMESAREIDDWLKMSLSAAPSSSSRSSQVPEQLLQMRRTQ